MPLSIPTLADALETAIKNINAEGDDVRREVAVAIATEVVEHIINNATIIVAAGIPVATAGSATAQTGATTSTGLASIT